MNLTAEIKHIFRSSGLLTTAGDIHAALSIREVAELLPDANPKSVSVSDIICRLERQGHLVSFQDSKERIRRFVVSIDILHATRLNILIYQLNEIKKKYGDDILIHEFTSEISIIDDGDINYISIK